MDLYLDDLRLPRTKRDWTIVRSFAEACAVCAERGPEFVSFDHDLGDEVPSGYDFAKWLVERDLDSGGTYLPADFQYNVHSANPVGAENITKLLDPYLSFRVG